MSELIHLLKRYAYREGEFTLSSGKQSNYYVNVKPVILTAVGLNLVCTKMIQYIDTKVVAGLTLGADPLIAGIVTMGLNGLIIRKEPKGYGTASQVEGPMPPIGTSITVLEDVTTTGGSSLKAVNVLRSLDYHVDRIVTVVDRQEGAEERLRGEDIELVSLVELDELKDV